VRFVRRGTHPASPEACKIAVAVGTVGWEPFPPEMAVRSPLLSQAQLLALPGPTDMLKSGPWFRMLTRSGQAHFFFPVPARNSHILQAAERRRTTDGQPARFRAAPTGTEAERQTKRPQQTPPPFFPSARNSRTCVSGSRQPVRCTNDDRFHSGCAIIITFVPLSAEVRVALQGGRAETRRPVPPPGPHAVSTIRRCSFGTLSEDTPDECVCSGGPRGRSSPPPCGGGKTGAHGAAALSSFGIGTLGHS